ncbi:hypothetical protein ACIRG5_47440 [Lentzea sp. NPDC102401]|uniref:hypothetical protein n=1 Tax=Lentzea sp. NPDC102401 TaxID=3364128 RepID=UPI0038216BEE
MELGEADGAGTLEGLVLRAVAGGRTTVKHLSELFSLPSRLMLDVVHGLWSRGLLAVDLTKNVLELTSTGLAACGRTEDESVVAKLDKDKFLFDPVTETIMPYRPGMERSQFGALEMPVTRGVDVSDIPQNALLRAVREAVRDERSKLLPRKVLKVSFANPLLSPPEAVQWKTVEVVLGRDQVTRQLTLTPVTTPPGWNLRAVQRFQSRVRELVRDRPDSRFVRRLLSEEAPAAAPPADLRALMVELAQFADDVSAVAPDELEDLHKELRATVTSVLTYVEDAERSRCSVECVAPGSGADWALTYLVEQAEQQIVLSVPRISYNALNKVLPLLETAAELGKRLVFLWGDHPSAALDGKTKIALLQLKAKFPRHVLLEGSSSRCTTSVIVCDDKQVFLSSRSVLSEDSGAGVLVGPRDGTTEAPECVLDVLKWAKKAYPDWETARRIAVLPTDFGAQQKDLDDAEPLLWRRLRLPEVEEGWRADEIGYRTKWAASWGRVLRELVVAVEEVYRGAPVVRAVAGGDYVDLVRRTIAGSAERLAIIDDNAETENCGTELAEMLLEAINRGVIVHLQHPQFHGGRRPVDKYADVLGEVTAAQTLRNTKGKARAVIRDHELVVGGHGPVGNKSARPTHGQPLAELGLHVVSTMFTAEFAASMGIRDWFGLSAGEEDAPRYLPPLPTLTGAQVDDDPWAVLDARLVAGAPPDRLRREAAMLLAGETDGGQRRENWGRWLLHEAWERRAFVEAGLLAPLIGDPEFPAAQAAAAIPLEHGPLGEQLYEFAVDLAAGPPEGRLTALVGVVAEMLLHGAESGLEVYDLLAAGGDGYREGLPPTWCRLVEEASACFSATRAPLPLADIDEWARKRAFYGDVRQSKEDLRIKVEAFEKGENHFNFVPGQKLHREMFMPGEIMTDVLSIARNEVSEVERARIAAALPEDARAYMNGLASKQLMIQKIAWSNHLTYARKVDHFVEEARRLAVIPDDHEARPVLAPEQRRFARFLEREWHRLESEAEALDVPVCHAANALLHWFSSMPTIGKEIR